MIMRYLNRSLNYRKFNWTNFIDYNLSAGKKLPQEALELPTQRDTINLTRPAPAAKEKKKCCSK